MSDTPRTDRVLKNCNGWHHVPIELARELERELNAANESFRKLNIHTLNLVDRIRRLEEAGDRMEPWCSDWDAASHWEKAKEAKP